MGTGVQVSGTAGGHQRLYRRLLRVYPVEYRAEYGDQMVQLFGDQLRDEGAARAWLRAAQDLPASAAAERERDDRRVGQSLGAPPSPFTRVLGLLGVAGGSVLLAGFLHLDAWTPDLFNLRLLLFNIGAIAVATAVHLRQSHAGRRLSLSGAIPVIVANAAYMLFTLKLVAQPGQLGAGDYQPINLFILNAAAMWLSDAWFGVVIFGLGVLNKWSAVALTVGSISAFVGMGVFGLAQSGSIMETLVLGGVALHGLAWVMLGLEVALRGTRVAAPTA
jgi:hypothetical protein